MIVLDIGTPVVYNGKFATIIGRDEQIAIIEFTDWRDGDCSAAPDADLMPDQDAGERL